MEENCSGFVAMKSSLFSRKVWAGLFAIVLMLGVTVMPLSAEAGVRYPKENYREFHLYFTPSTQFGKLVEKVDGIGRVACGAVNERDIQYRLSRRGWVPGSAKAYQAATVNVSGKFANQTYYANGEGINTTPWGGYINYYTIPTTGNATGQLIDKQFTTVRREKDGIAGEWESRDFRVGEKEYALNGNVIRDQSLKEIRLANVDALLVTTKARGRTPLYIGDSAGNSTSPLPVKCPGI
jgi:hypothetical protein